MALFDRLSDHNLSSVLEPIVRRDAVRQLAFFLFLAVLLVAGGMLMNSLNQQAATNSPGFGIRSQTYNPEANPANVTAGKAATFMLFAGILVGSLGGAATLLTVAMWLFNRQVMVAKQTPNQGFSFSLDPTKKHSLGAVIATNQGIVIGVVVLIIVALGVGFAIASGMFTPQ
jgi:hypothetical protein